MENPSASKGHLLCNSLLSLALLSIFLFFGLSANAQLGQKAFFSNSWGTVYFNHIIQHPDISDHLLILGSVSTGQSYNNGYYEMLLLEYDLASGTIARARTFGNDRNGQQHSERGTAIVPALSSGNSRIFYLVGDSRDEPIGVSINGLYDMLVYTVDAQFNPVPGINGIFGNNLDRRNAGQLLDINISEIPRSAMLAGGNLTILSYGQADANVTQPNSCPTAQPAAYSADNFLITTIDPSGSVLSTFSNGASGSETPMQFLANGSELVSVGRINTGSRFSADIQISNLDGSLPRIFEVHSDIQGHNFERFMAVATNPMTGNYICAGETSPNENCNVGSDMILVEFDPAGNAGPGKRIDLGLNQDERVIDVMVKGSSSNAKLLVWGATHPQPASGLGYSQGDHFLMQLDLNFNHEWTRVFKGSLLEGWVPNDFSGCRQRGPGSPGAILEMANGNLAMIGHTLSYGSINLRNGFLVVTNGSGFTNTANTDSCETTLSSVTVSNINFTVNQNGNSHLRCTNDSTFGPVVNNPQLQVVNGCIPPPSNNAVPTLSQWGLILCGLLLVNLGAIALWKRKRQLDRNIRAHS